MVQDNVQMVQMVIVNYVDVEGLRKRKVKNAIKDLAD